MRGASLLAMRVWSRPEDAGPLGVHLGRAGLVRARAVADQLLVEALERWTEKLPEVAVRRAIRHSLDVPVALLAANRTAQLAVVGSTRWNVVRRNGPAASYGPSCTGPGVPVAVVPVG